MFSYTILIYKTTIFESSPNKPPMNEDVCIQVKIYWEEWC